MAGKMNKRQINLKIDADLYRFVRTRANKEGTSQIAIYEEALEFLRTRNRIDERIRASIAENLDRYETPGAYTKAMMENTRFRHWKQAFTLVNPEDWITEQTYIALAEWQRRGADGAALDYVLETEYMIPRECFTAEPLPFAEENNEVPAARSVNRQRAKVTA
jgi:hypothetical protein